MEKEQIVKALECCVKAQTAEECKKMGCPASTQHGCRFYLRTDEDYDGVIYVELVKEALALIRELIKENEMLKEAECDQCACKLLDERDEARQEVAQAKADTVLKMQSEIEARCIKAGVYPAIVASTVDKVVEEMLEGKTDAE